MIYTLYQIQAVLSTFSVPSVYLGGMNHKEDILYEYFDVSYGRMDTEAFLDKYSFDYVMITEGSPMYFDLEKDDGYEAVYAEEGYVVYRSTG